MYPKINWGVTLLVYVISYLHFWIEWTMYGLNQTLCAQMCATSSMHMCVRIRSVIVKCMYCRCSIHYLGLQLPVPPVVSSRISMMSSLLTSDNVALCHTPSAEYIHYIFRWDNTPNRYFSATSIKHVLPWAALDLFSLSLTFDIRLTSLAND